MHDLDITMIRALTFTLVGLAIADALNPYDLSSLTKGAAIGDSYAAGIGAGTEINWSCSRYNGSYANLVSQSLEVDPSTQDFTFSACSGATVSTVNDQAKALSTDQQYVMVSAGGVDCDFAGILNSCVYSFYAGLYHPNCDQKITEAQNTIQSNEFAASIAGLISNVKTKLASGGNIYYVGYAQFFDTSDNTCDTVSWNVWYNLFSKEYLTQARRQSMNFVVDAVNQVLRSVISQAGPEVHFIDYDKYVGMTNGRYCQPGQDESRGRSANRRELFFYEMMTNDSPPGSYHGHDQLKRRQNTYNDDGNIQPVNGTLEAVYGALLQEAVQEAPDLAVLQDDNADSDLLGEVLLAEALELVPRDSTLTPGAYVPLVPHLVFGRGLNRTGNSSITWNTTASTDLVLYSNNTNTIQGKRIILGTSMSSESTGLTSNYTRTLFTSGNSSSHGTVIANSSHVLLANGVVVKRINIGKFFVSDETSRVFHPTQDGHALIANLILYHMTADRASSLDICSTSKRTNANALSLGITTFPPEVVQGTGNAVPSIGGAACLTDSTDTWTDRDAMISAVNDFCADPSNLRGSTGGLTSGTFNTNTLDYVNVSISWEQSQNIGQHSCAAWLSTVTDGCDVPNADGANAQNLKHGGTIAYQSPALNATMSIEPLVVRRLWDKVQQSGGQQCNDISTTNYIDQATLQANIDDYCSKSAAQPNGIATSGSTFSMVYNDGTPSRVVLATVWPPGPRNYQIFQAECQYYMGVVNNGCSFPNVNNIMNWKHGGSMSDANGIKYTITPTQTRPPPPSGPLGKCVAHRYWWGYTWTVTGGGFANSDWGRNLLQQMRGCANSQGGVTSWKFDYFDTVQADGSEWTASGTLPITISHHCAAKAVVSAGGFPSNC